MYKIVTKVEKNAQKFQHMYITVCVCFFFWGRTLATWQQKKKANPTKGFLRFKKKSPYLDKKSLEVARARQDSKTDLLVHQDSHHFLLINAEDPS
jgi:hypothetical protein